MARSPRQLDPNCRSALVDRISGDGRSTCEKLNSMQQSQGDALKATRFFGMWSALLSMHAPPLASVEVRADGLTLRSPVRRRYHLPAGERAIRYRQRSLWLGGRLQLILPLPDDAPLAYRSFLPVSRTRILDALIAAGWKVTKLGPEDAAGL